MLNILPIISALILSGICGFIFIPAILSFCKKRNLYDIPNQRKMHHTLVPRLGGIAFLPSMLIAFFIAILVMSKEQGGTRIPVNMWSLGFMASLLLIYAIGIVDDITGLGAKTKFTAQIISASILPLCGLYINNLYGFFGVYKIPFWVGFPLTVFIIVFIDNAMNLIDGIDGLAASLTLLSLVGFLYGFIDDGLWVYGILISGLIGILIPFLYFNIWGKEENNRKVFMGDSGSLTLGFVLGFLFVKYTMDNRAVAPFSEDKMIKAYSLLIIPTFDVCRVMIHRFRTKTPIFHADKNHIHHKMMKMGLSMHQTLVAIICLALFFILANSILYPTIGITWVFIIDVCLYTCVHVAINKHTVRKAKRGNI
jgi:UDP-GlcNAc:undecaprenyl-phosphate GlcNAc-1-phosphate transferase